MSKIKEMGLVSLIITTVIITMVIGYQIKNKVWGSSFIKILIWIKKKYILEISNKISFPAWAYYYI